MSHAKSSSKSFSADTLVDSFNIAAGNLPLVQSISDKSGLPPFAIALLCGALCLLLFGFVAPLASYVVGVAYPTLMSFRALESNDKSDDKQWLTYWVVFAFVQFVENFMSPVLSIIPLYFVLKMVFLLWLALPKTKGAEKLYSDYIQHFMNNHRATVDKLCKFSDEAAAAVPTENLKNLQD